MGGQLLPLQELKDDFITSKLRNLALVQAMVLPDHPESLFVEAFLNEAKVADKKSVAKVMGRPSIGMREDLVSISGKAITYRYSSLLYAPPVDDPQRIIFGVLSAAHNRNARHMIRSTWAQDQENVFFLVAGPWENISTEFFLHGDILWLDIEESYYYSLTYKTGLFLHATDKHVEQYSYAFKTDHDSYIVVEKLREALHGNRPDYWGNCNFEKKWRRPDRDPSSKHYMPPGTYSPDLYPVSASGMGDALSSDFNNCASRHLESLPFMPMEDISVGMLAERCNAQCKLDEGKFTDGPGNIVSH